MAWTKKKSASGNPTGPGIDAKGRSKDKGVWLPLWLIESAAYLAMTPTARCLLMQIGSIAWGANNGRWFMSVRDAAAMLGVSDRTAACAINELLQHGFLVIVQDAKFERKTANMMAARARVWRATWLPVRNYRNQKGSGPSGEFRNWRPTTRLQNQRIEKGREVLARWRSAKKIADADFAEVATIPYNCNPISDADFAEVKPEKPTIVRQTTYAESTTHSIITMGDGGREPRATSSQCFRARNAANEWLSAGNGRTQKQLAAASGIDPAKFSRWLADVANRKTLTVRQIRALFAAIGLDGAENEFQPMAARKAAR